mmetsp:Transcript_28177/g.68536  ORF Transcript_28177/g.68536 Transcript_28177/m.68536 type:complete len:106 (-) Transcript_28177:99-416(-)
MLGMDSSQWWNTRIGFLQRDPESHKRNWSPNPKQGRAEFIDKLVARKSVFTKLLGRCVCVFDNTERFLDISAGMLNSIYDTEKNQPSADVFRIKIVLLHSEQCEL